LSAWLLLLAATAASADQTTLSLTKVNEVADNSVGFGESYWYTINYECSAIDASGCTGAVITDQIPEELTLLQASGANAIANTDNFENDRTVRFTFDYTNIPNVPAGDIPDGTASQVLIQVRLQSELDPGITQISNTAVSTVTNDEGVDDSDTDLLDVDPLPAPVWSVSKTVNNGQSSVELAKNATYTIEFCLQSGYGDLTDYQIIDRLPEDVAAADVSFITDGGVLSGTGQQTITWTLDLPYADPPTCESVSYTVVYPDANANDKWDRNEALTSVTNEGEVKDSGGTELAEFTLTHDLIPFVQNLNTVGQKVAYSSIGGSTVDGSTWLLDDGVHYDSDGGDDFRDDAELRFDVEIDNGGRNVELQALAVTDTFGPIGTTPARIDSVDPDTDVITIPSHGFTDGQRVKFLDLSGSIVGLTSNHRYYVEVLGENSVRMLEERGDGDPIDLGAASGDTALAPLPLPVVIRAIGGTGGNILYATGHVLPPWGEEIAEGMAVRYRQAGDNPINGLTDGGVYYVRELDGGNSQAFKLSDTRDGPIRNISTGAGDDLDLFDPLRRLEPTKFTTGSYVNAPTGMTVDLLYSTSSTVSSGSPDSEFTRYEGTGFPFDATDNAEITIADLGLSAGQITAVRWRFNLAAETTLPTDFEADIAPRVYADLLGSLAGGIEPAPEAFVRNCVMHYRTSAFDGRTGTSKEICRVLFDRGPRRPLWVEKSRIGSGTFISDGTEAYGTLDFSLTLGADANYGLDADLDLDLVNPVFYDLLPAELEYVGWSVTENTIGIAVPAPVEDTSWTGSGTLLRWSFTGTFQPGQTIIGTLQTRPVDAAFPEGTENTDLSNQLAGKPADEDPFYCPPADDEGVDTGSVADSADFDNDGSIVDQICSDSVSVTVRAPRLTIETDKINQTGSVGHGQTATMQVSFQATGTAGKDLALVNPVLTDVLPAGLEYVEDSWQLVSGTPSPTFLDPDVDQPSGRTRLRWSWNSAVGGGTDHSFAVGDDPIVISYQVRVPLGTPEGDYTNAVYVLPGANALRRCPVLLRQRRRRHQARGQLQGHRRLRRRRRRQHRRLRLHHLHRHPGPADARSCSPRSWSAASSTSQYHKYPDSGFTIPGGDIDYRIRVTNGGNVVMTDFVLVDILPYVGDSQVNRPEKARLSQWRPVLTGPITAPEGATVYYSTSSNPCRGEINPEPRWMWTPGPTAAMPIPGA
jgi:uncharacterized repeat protein (TIGR01451 family)